MHKIVNKKWTYKQTSYTTSSSSSLSGWTKYDTQGNGAVMVIGVVGVTVLLEVVIQDK